MAKKAPAKKAAGKTAAPKAAAKRAPARPKPAGQARTPGGVRLRMYRLGVGDCFLLSLPREGGGEFHMLIDCGVHQAQSGGGEKIKLVAADIKERTGGHIDVVVGTHEHWDHISGFAQASETFADMKAGEIWFSWAEDDTDALAKSLHDKKGRALTALFEADNRFRLSLAPGEVSPLEGLLGFYGDGTGTQSRKATAALKALAPGRARYHKPGGQPLRFTGVGARFYVLGPPRDATLIARDAPSKKNSEVYAFGAYEGLMGAVEGVLADFGKPFATQLAIALERTNDIPFFRMHYWNEASPDAPSPRPARRSRAAVPEDGESGGEDWMPPSSDDQPREDFTQSWRRIDADWLGAATSLALKLDEDTNNTSLVIAVELVRESGPQPVLLFAADAQVGNWLSWQDVAFVDETGRKVTGPDLLKRTVVYKVGHHASHNATLRELGLELMDDLEVALIPTDSEMAKKVKWGTLPWDSLLKRLDEKTGGRAVRSDQPLSAKAKGARVTAGGPDDLYYELEI